MQINNHDLCGRFICGIGMHYLKVRVAKALKDRVFQSKGVSHTSYYIITNCNLLCIPFLNRPSTIPMLRKNSPLASRRANPFI
jgi:hypothetical protein